MPEPRGSRNLILDAAEKLVTKEGAGRLTLDSVAARAGISKGGLLYHFRSKEALLRAMVDRLCQSFDARISEEAGKNSGPGYALHAYVAAALDRTANGSVASGLLAAIPNDLKLLDPMREHMHRWLIQLRPESESFADRAILWLATEGLWLLELLDLSPLNQTQRRAIAARLIQRAGDRGVAGQASARRPQGSARVPREQVPRPHRVLKSE
jgi:AcrR family transcriptional regulator